MIAENEQLQASVQQWTEKVKHYIAEKTRVTAELYLRDEAIAKVCGLDVRILTAS